MSDQTPGAPAPAATPTTSSPAPASPDADFAAMAAEFDAADAADQPIVAPDGETDVDAPEAPAADAHPDVAPDQETKPEAEGEPKPDANEPPSVAAARKILATAARKEKRALDLQRESKAASQKANAYDDLIAGLLTNPHATIAKHLPGRHMGHVLDAATAEQGDAAPKGEPKPEDRITAVERQLQADQVARLEANVAARKAQITTAVTAAADRFPRINRGGAHEMVTDLMFEYHGKHGVPLDPMVAARQVEQYLAQLAGEPITPASSKPATRASAPATKTPTSKRPGTTTLTNADTGSVSPDEDALPLDEDERFQANLRYINSLG